MTFLACRLFRSIPLGIIFSLAAVSLALPQQPTPAASAPVPPQILTAKKVFISNGGGDDYFNGLVDDGPNRAYNQFYPDMQHWARYQIVSSPADADLVFEISAITQAGINVSNGSGMSTYAPQLRLRIIDPKTQSRLWTMTSNLNLVGLKKTRDKKFDAGVVNLVNQVKQLVGEPLTSSESAAIRRSSGPSTRGTVLIAVAAVGAGAALGLIVYAVAHHNAPQLPATPACTTPPYPFCPVSASRR